MSIFGNRLRELRNEKGLSQSELAKQIRISKSAVNMYERGEREPNFETLEIIADYFNVDLDYLLGKTECKNRASEALHFISQMPQMRKWKVLGATACGAPLHKELEDESVLAPSNIDADFVFRCEGDSMIGARILDGDVVFVKHCEVENGQIAVVRIGEEYTLKRIYRGPDYLELRAENPKYAPIIIRGEQENAEIIGKAVQFLSRVL